MMIDDDDVYYYIRWRLKLEGETENTGVCTKERKGVTAAVLMATPCTDSLDDTLSLGKGGKSFCGNQELLKKPKSTHRSRRRRARRRGTRTVETAGQVRGQRAG